MLMEIRRESENHLFKRKEIELFLDFGRSRTPSKAEMQLAVSKDKGVAPEQVEITEIFSENGRAFGRAFARVWSDKKVGIYGKKEEKEEEKKAAPKDESEEKAAGNKAAPKTDEKG